MQSWSITVLGLIGVLALSGCAKPAKVAPMTVGARPDAVLADSTLERAVCVEEARGGKSTNPLWVSEVDNVAFLKALEGSLRNNGLLAEGESVCRYGVEAHLLGLSQPFVGLDVEVTANVNYRVRKPGRPEPYYLDTVQSAYTTRFTTDKILWGSRLRDANEGAMRKNIRKFVDALMAQAP